MSKTSRRAVSGALSLIAIAWVGSAANGAVIARYGFDNNSLAWTAKDANVTAGDITGSPTVNNQPTSVLSIVNNINYPSQPTLAAARSSVMESGTRANVYFTFTVTPATGQELDLTSLTFNVAQGGGNPNERDYDVRSSVDGYATSLSGGIITIPTIRTTFTPVTIPLSANAFQNLASPTTFQIRFFTPGVSQNVDFDDIVLNGAVQPVAVPEPASIGLLGAVSGLLLARGRRRNAV